LADGFGGAGEFSSTPGAASWSAIAAAVSAEAGFEPCADAEFFASDATPIAAEAVAYGDDAERARIETILNSPAAKGREELARHFAFKTDMSSSDAISALAASMGRLPASPAAAEPYRTPSYAAPAAAPSSAGASPPALARVEASGCPAAQVVAKMKAGRTGPLAAAVSSSGRAKQR
jgi:hypothetical protein